MKRRFPLRSKLASATCILLGGLFLIELDALLAQTPDPILDVVASGGTVVVDKSKSKRKLKTLELSPGTEEKAVYFSTSTAITIPFNEQDPLFIQGPCTWMIRCKINQTQEFNEGYLLAGRWEGREDQRIMMLGLARKTGHPALQVSSVGGLDARGVVKLKSQVPGDVWVTIVGRFDPGVELAVQLFDEKGELLESAVISKVPGVLPDFPLPFIIGRGVPSEIQFARFRAWNSALSDEDIITAVTTK